eukprot:scaffold10220_cov66-Skeletonema_dohrnii-CCMP3373.AAC.1
MGEAPRARITAQNTLTTWHADRLYGAMSIEKGEDLVGYSSCKFDGAPDFSASKRFQGSYDIDSAVKRV